MNGVTDVRCPAVSMIPETPTIRLLWQTVLLFITQATAKGWEDMICHPLQYEHRYVSCTGECRDAV